MGRIPVGFQECQDQFDSRPTLWQRAAKFTDSVLLPLGLNRTVLSRSVRGFSRRFYAEILRPPSVPIFDVFVRFMRIWCFPAYVVGMIATWYRIRLKYDPFKMLLGPANAAALPFDVLLLPIIDCARNYMLEYTSWWVLAPAVILSIPESLRAMADVQSGKAKVSNTKFGFALAHALQQPSNRVLFLVHWGSLRLASPDRWTLFRCNLCSITLNFAVVKYGESLLSNIKRKKEYPGVLAHCIVATYTAAGVAALLILERRAVAIAKQSHGTETIVKEQTDLATLSAVPTALRSQFDTARAGIIKVLSLVLLEPGQIPGCDDRMQAIVSIESLFVCLFVFVG